MWVSRFREFMNSENSCNSWNREFVNSRKLWNFREFMNSRIREFVKVVNFHELCESAKVGANFQRKLGPTSGLSWAEFVILDHEFLRNSGPIWGKNWVPGAHFPGGKVRSWGPSSDIMAWAIWRVWRGIWSWIWRIWRGEMEGPGRMSWGSPESPF